MILRLPLRKCRAALRADSRSDFRRPPPLYRGGCDIPTPYTRGARPTPPLSGGARGVSHNRLMETRIRQGFSSNRETRFSKVCQILADTCPDRRRNADLHNAGHWPPAAPPSPARESSGTSPLGPFSEPVEQAVRQQGQDLIQSRIGRDPFPVGTPACLRSVKVTLAALGQLLGDIRGHVTSSHGM